jgi:hypothetical protein
MHDHVALLLSVLLLSCAALEASGSAAKPAPDKSPYTFFQPTPDSLLRELVTDRPDKTEAPYTVDAGHFQVELDLVTYTRDTADGTRTERYGVAPVNFKAGLLNNVDLQLIAETWNRVSERSGTPRRSSAKSGFGDTTARLKINFWGNDGGDSAFALMPYVKFPTNQNALGNKSVEGGLIVPLALKLPDGWGLGLMHETDIVRNDAGGGYHAEFVHTATFDHEICGTLGGYIEFFSLLSGKRGPRWVGTLDLGLTYGFSQTTQLDAGVNLGLTRSADDINPFVGLSVRF